MDLKNRLKSLRESQQKLLSESETILKEYESSNIINENLKIRQELDDCKQQLEEISQILQRSNQENDSLKLALREQILDEKLHLLKVSRQKLATYFEDQTNKYSNSLTALELMTKAKLNELREITERKLEIEKMEILHKIEQLSAELDERLRNQKVEFETTKKNLADGAEQDLNEMAAAGVSEAVVQKRLKQNQLEMKIGLEWINKIGILLILLGVGFASQYTYTNWMTKEMKGISFFLLGGLFLVGGEWFFRKKREIFAKGLLGGGVSILYSAIFYSLFQLKIINLDIGLLLSVLVTLATLVLSIRYNSRTICSLGLCGGYLPFFTYVFTFGLGNNSYLAVMGYLFILNSLVLSLSFWKKWNVVNYLSLILNLPTMIYLVLRIPKPMVGIEYALLTFAMYLVITLAYPLKYKIALKAPDLILLGLNTLANCLILYQLFDKAGFGHYQGLLALIFCISYLGLGWFTGRTMQVEKGTMILFYATALTFAILMVPFQFGVNWLSMGWLVEGMLLIIYGYKNQIKKMESVGWGIFLLCLGTFFINEYLAKMLLKIEINNFDYKYTAIIIGMLVVTLVYHIDFLKNRVSQFTLKGKWLTALKYFALFSLWLYLWYLGVKYFKAWVPANSHFGFFKSILVALINIGTGYLITRIPSLVDKTVKVFGVILYLIGDLIFLYLNLFTPVLDENIAASSNLAYISLGVLVLFNLFMLLNVRDLLLRLIHKQGYSLEIYPILMALLLLGNITAWLVTQFRLGEYNLLISFVYLSLAIGYIIYGFKKKFIYIRRLGLGLTLFATAKLFIYDLAFLGMDGKIFAYFGFGVVLLGISFIYQKLKNSMEGDNVSTTTKA